VHRTGFIELGALRLIGAWLSLETEALESEASEILPYLLQVAEKSYVLFNCVMVVHSLPKIQTQSYSK